MKNKKTLHASWEMVQFTISVIRWAQILEANKRKLSYLASRLRVKDVGVEEKINQDFNEIGFDKVRSVLRKVALPD